MPKYDIEVELTSEDGNGFAIIGRVSRALLEAGVPDEAVADFVNKATSGDYSHLIATCAEWVEVS